jgi:hypothetical protein
MVVIHWIRLSRLPVVRFRLFDSYLLGIAFRRLNFGKPSSAASKEPTLANRMGLRDVLVHAQQVLAQAAAGQSKDGHFQALPVATTVAEWDALETQSWARKDSEGECAICRDGFKLEAQVLLSCSHTFHLSCIASFERFTGTQGAAFSHIS